MAMKSVLTECYIKGEVSVKDKEPREEFKDLPKNTITVRIKHGSKVRNIMGFVEKSFKDEANRCMIFTGCGDAIEKTITCVEITKTKFKDLHQITKLDSLRVEEYWDPIKEDLDRIKVLREIPMVSILVSKDPLDTNELGYQAAEKPTNVKKSFKRKKIHHSATSAKNSPAKEILSSE